MLHLQVAGWVSCVVSARLTVGAVILTTAPLLVRLLRRIDAHFAGHKEMLLLLVMVGLPMLLNVGQAWLQVSVQCYVPDHACMNGGQAWLQARHVNCVTSLLVRMHAVQCMSYNGAGHSFVCSCICVR